MGMIFDAPKRYETHVWFIDWLRDMDCLVNVPANYDYCDKFALNNMLPKKMHKASESDKIDFINELIYHLIFD